jgi:hypothetical protein
MLISEMDSAVSGYDYEYNNHYWIFIKIGEILVADSEEIYSNEIFLTLINSDDIHSHVR